jgi:hypothetical protein
MYFLRIPPADFNVKIQNNFWNAFTNFNPAKSTKLVYFNYLKVKRSTDEVDDSSDSELWYFDLEETPVSCSCRIYIEPY